MARDGARNELPVPPAMISFEEHENGQMRLTADGEQLALLPLPDSLIPNDAELQAVDDGPADR